RFRVDKASDGLTTFLPCAPPHTEKQERQNNVQHDDRPQQWTGPFAADGEIKKISSNEQAVGQHAAERSAARQAGNTQREQGDAGNARYRLGTSGEVRAEQQSPD